MNAAPHKLYLKKEEQEPYQNEDGNWVVDEATFEYLCDCFLHDLSTKEQIGLAGVGIKASKKINLDRNDSLKMNDVVKVLDGELIRVEGSIKQIKSTSIVGNYTQILV